MNEVDGANRRQHKQGGQGQHEGRPAAFNAGEGIEEAIQQGAAIDEAEEAPFARAISRALRGLARTEGTIRITSEVPEPTSKPEAITIGIHGAKAKPIAPRTTITFAAFSTRPAVARITHGDSSENSTNPTPRKELRIVNVLMLVSKALASNTISAPTPPTWAPTAISETKVAAKI